MTSRRRPPATTDSFGPRIGDPKVGTSDFVSRVASPAFGPLIRNQISETNSFDPDRSNIINSAAEGTDDVLDRSIASVSAQLRFVAACSDSVLNMSCSKFSSLHSQKIPGRNGEHLVKLTITIIIAAIFGSASLRAAKNDETILLNGTAIDPGSGKITPNAVIKIKDGRITAVENGDGENSRKGENVIDVQGKFILPGYIDSHVHFFQSGDLYTRPDAVDLTSIRPYKDEIAWIDKNLGDTFARYIRCGITSVVDVGGPMTNFRLRQLAAESEPAPRIAVAGPLISSVARPQLELNGDGPIAKIETAAQGVQFVRKLAKRSPDYVKIWYVVDPESPVEKFRPIVHAAVGESHRLKLRVAVHATELETARAAVEEGADLLVHSVTDKPVDQTFVRLLQERGTILCPTLVVFERYG